MNLGEIRDECWALARESGTNDVDRLWPTDEMNRYINRVYRDIARQTLCITDAETPAICLIPSDPVDYTTYTSGTLDYIWANDPDSPLYQTNVCPYLYALDPRVLQIEEVKWVKRRFRLVHVSSNKWKENTLWEQTIGVPTEFATDYTNNKIALNCRSESSDTLQLQVKRLPLNDLVDDTDEPEFRQDYHDCFFYGVLTQMYSKQDSDTLDPTLWGRFKKQYIEDIDSIKQAEIRLEERLRPNPVMSAFR